MAYISCTNGLQGSLSYGSIASKRNCFLRKLDLPPKFTAALNSTHSSAMTPPQPVQYAPASVSVPDPSSSSVSMCSQPLNTTVTVALHPQVPQFVPSQQLTPAVQHTPNVATATAAAISIPLANFEVNNLSHNTNFALATSNGVHSHITPGQFAIQQGMSIIPNFNLFHVENTYCPVFHALITLSYLAVMKAYFCSA